MFYFGLKKKKKKKSTAVDTGGLTQVEAEDAFALIIKAIDL